LPKWANEAIERLTRERDEAVKALNDARDIETESPFFMTEIDHRTNEVRKHFLQVSGLKLNWAGVELSFILREEGIDLLARDVLTMIPRSANSIRILPRSEKK